MSERAITEVIGVYHADGGVLGELRYVLGKVRGTTHCDLCDLTHGRGVRRRREWDAMADDLGLPVRLLHLNEMPDDVAGVVREHGSPVVLGRGCDGSLQPLLGAEEMGRMQGSVTAFGSALRAALQGHHLPD